MNITMNITMMNNNGFILLMQAFDSLFPIGAFTLSNGMENYTQKEIVKDKKSLISYLKSYLYVLPFTDLGFAAKAYEGEDIVYLDELCTASKTPFEIRSGSEKLCMRFLKTENALGDYPKLRKYYDLIKDKKCTGQFPVAVGLFISDTSSEELMGLKMYCYSLISMTVNHAVKLIPLGQTDGQKALTGVMDLITKSAERAMNVSICDLGISGAGFDISSMEHERLYSRIYIS